MVVAPVDDGDMHPGAGKRARAFEAAEAGADDDDTVLRLIHRHDLTVSLHLFAV
jgi:hypothetical protein